MDVIRIATRNGAGRLGEIGKELETAEVGKLADLVVLEADPTVEIGNARKVNRVSPN